VFLFSCGGSGSSSKQVAVSWNADTDTVVNSDGGGYTVYYSQQSDFDLSSATKLDVPYVSGAAAAPTSVTLTLGTGMWFLRVAAYGVLDGTATSSDASEQISVNVGG